MNPRFIVPLILLAASGVLPCGPDPVQPECMRSVLRLPEWVSRRRKNLAATSPFIRRCDLAVLLILSPLILWSAAASAATHAWPDLHGGTDCLGTLQNCIDASAPGDTVVIGQDIVTQPGQHYYGFSESITIAKSLTLSGAQGLDAVFGIDNTITVNSPSTGAISVTLDHLVLRGGGVSFSHNSDTASTYTISSSRFTEIDTANGCAIAFTSSAGGSGDAQIHATGNTMTFRNPRNGAIRDAICFAGGNGAASIDFSGNRIHADNDALQRAIDIYVAAGGVTAGVAQNQLSGSGITYGISFDAGSAGASSAVYIDNNAIIGLRAGGMAMLAQPGATNATQILVRNNTVAWGATGLNVYPGSVQSGSGIYNNIFAFNSSYGLYVPTALSGVIANDYNLVYGNGTTAYTPGPHTVLADPAFLSYLDPRLNDSSPALDAGSNANAPGVLGIGFDADGEKRIVNGTVDIGAFESNGDAAIVQTSTPANTSGNIVRLDASWPRDLGTSAEHLLVTPIHQPGGSPSELAANIGVYLNGSLTPWSLFREDLGTVSTGRSFAAFAPADGRTNYLHVANAGNSGSGVDQFGTQLDNAAFNSLSSAVLFVEHNWNQGGATAGAYFDHPLGVFYSGSRWHVRDEDNVPMPTDGSLGINVVAAPLGSSNAFTVYPPAQTSEFWLSHPLLDNNPCAVLMTTRNTGMTASPPVLDNAAYSVRYTPGSGGAPGHWSILAEGAGPPTFTTADGFNVMVHGAQANACRDDVIFADGFDGVTQ